MQADLEPDAVKQDFRRRWIRQLVVLVVVIGALALSGVFTKGGGAEPVLAPSVMAAVVVGLLVFSLFNWRCPSCKRYLGRALYPRHCSGCGVQLR